MRSVAAVVALAACLHAGLWAYFETSGRAPAITKRLESVSYAPFERMRNPDDVPTEAQIRADLKAISGYADSIRTYRSTRGMEIVPRIAGEFGLKVTLGIDLEPNLDSNANYDLVCDPDEPDRCDKRVSRNEAEIKTAIRLAHTYNNVNAILVGNETTLRRSMLAAAEADEAEEAYQKQVLHEDPETHEKKPYADFRAALRDTKRDWDDQVAKAVAKRVAELKISGTSGVGTSSSRIDSKDIEEGIRAAWNVDELMKVIQRVKRDLGPNSVPVSTGETWDIWYDHPKLATVVDFVAAHILPYWDKAPADKAVDHTLDIFYDKLQAEHPGKHIVIAEFGWPSAGFNRGPSEPGRLEQASVLRQFVDRANALGIDYNIIEAFDQPWKTSEGSVGRYWGIFDASRQAKFAWTGPIDNADYWKIAALAVTLGFLISLPILSMAGATARQAALMTFAAHVVGAWSATVVDYWNGHYFVLGAAFALLVGLVLLVPLVLIALARIREIATVLFGGAPRRLLAPAAPAQDYAPKVSIHIPAYREPPEMLKQTLDALARLDYPNFECVVVINNTPDPAFWQPVAEHCGALGERFKFVNVEQVAGYKAGALRIALAHTAPDAEIIGVIDADYAVEPDWLKDVVPAFADPKVGLVQAPQDHRDETTPLHWAMNGEYAGFFDIGMVQRNEENAIIVHGTMCLIRRSALAAAGGWSSDTICEDTDLGLAIIEQGWVTHYTRRRYGRGLLPDTFEAYKKQRHRWAFGGLQIIRKHWRRFLPGESRLTHEQKREFAIGWLNWLGAESIGVAVAVLNLVWVPVVAFAGLAIPDKVLTLPIIAAFAVSVAHFLALYQRRVAIPPGQMAAAMFAAMSMQWTVARAVAYGLVTEHLPFVRTAKGGSARTKRVRFPAFYEALLGTLLLAGATVVFASNHESVREINIFGAVLMVQSLPFLSAAALAAVEETRLNDFVFWREAPTRLVARMAELLPRRTAAVSAVIPQPAAPPAENRIEAAP
jgi:cellulose synthase/poly-beta-1,6-N-acetylglucosamine synthase-like glycosyltransferase/exo-beta-1,3-glucanase (GH17 family)